MENAANQAKIFDTRQAVYVAAKAEFLAAYQAASAFWGERQFHSAHRPGDAKFRAAFTAEGAELIAQFWATKPAYHAAKRAYREVSTSTHLDMPICPKFNRYAR